MKKTTFIFDDVRIAPKQQIGMHSHNLWELSYILLGKGIHTIGDTTEPFEEGEIILIPPRIAHVWQFDPSNTDTFGNIANISVFFNIKTLKDLENIFPEYAPLINKISSQTEALCYAGETCKTISRLLLSMRGLSPIMRVPKMLELITALSDTDNCQKAGRNNLLSKTEQRLEKVRIYCSCNHAREISLDEIAAYTGMNKSAFCTFMRRHMGTSFSKFLNETRLERAMEMLCNTDNNISTIAYDVGFSNVTYFNRQFRAQFGCTPKSVRKLNQSL